MRRVKEWLPADSIVTVPTVHLYDEEANIIVMDDCGPNSFTLKELVKDRDLGISLASEIGMALGGFLRRFHTWGKRNQSLIDFFDSNQQAKTISAWVTYGRLVSTLTGEDQLDSLTLRPPNVSEHQLSAISQLAAEKISAMISSSDSVCVGPCPLSFYVLMNQLLQFVMGDFWPGNILISLDTYQTRLDRIYIIDWEMAKPGILGTDIGQFCAEMSLLRWFHPETGPSVSTLITTFLESYRYSNNIDVSLCRDSIVHTGAHLVAWTPRVSWGSREQTTQVVEEGVNYLIQGWTGNYEWLKASLLGSLLA